jgi:hypothetical protein
MFRSYFDRLTGIEQMMKTAAIAAGLFVLGKEWKPGASGDQIQADYRKSATTGGN